MKPIFRYRADIKTVIFVSIYFALVIFQWLHPPTRLAVAIPMVMATCLFSFFGAVATHNTVHAPVFYKRWLNRVFQCVLTITYGHPVSSYVPGHNLSHHKHTQTRRDVMRTSKLRYRWNFLNVFLFSVTVSKAVMRANLRFMASMKTRNPGWYRQVSIEWLVYFATMGTLLILDWKKFLLYVLLPHQYAAFGIMGINLLQHDGCDPDSEYNHSRNFTGTIVNWLAFNNGYHSIHHIQPGLHWSLLPEEHAKRVHPFIHPNLEQVSLMVYLWKNFGYPAKRLRYDGTPVILPEEGPDEEWIPGPSETPSDVSLGAVPYPSAT